MNLTFHQFRKEMRYLWPQWVLWLVVLAIDLAVDAEWLSPMRADGIEPPWYALLPILVWGGAIWLAVSFPPEDAFADDHSFIAVKPLPRCSYWSSRCLVLGLMIIAPLVLEEGIYLWVSRRPAEDIGLGMFEQAFVAVAVLGWLLPMPALARGWQRYGVVGVALFSGAIIHFATDQVLRRGFRMHAEMFVTSNKMAQAAWFAAFLVAGLAWWQRQRRWTYARTLTGIVAITMCGFALACSPLLETWSSRPRDPAWVAGIEAKSKDSLTPLLIKVSRFENKDGEEEVSIRSDVEIPDLPADISPRWRYQRSTVTQRQNRWSSTSDYFRGYQFFFVTAVWAEDDARLAAAFAPTVAAGTLAKTRSKYPTGIALSYGSFIKPANLEAPIEMDSQHEADWVRYSLLGSHALEAGSSIRSRWADVEVLSIATHKDAEDKPEPGSVTITFKQSARTLELGGNPFPEWGQSPLMLYAPKKRILWQDGGGGGIFVSRAVHSGWTRGVYRMCWKDVIKPGTGVTADHLQDLRLLLTHQEYLGTSRHSIAIHHLKLSDYFQPFINWPYPQSPLVRENPREAFQETIARLPKPALDAPRDEIARYVARVCVLAQSLAWRNTLNDDGSPRWPGNDHIIADQLAPFVLRHPDIITNLPYIDKLGGDHFIRQVLDSTVLLAGLPHVSRSKELDGLAYEEVKPGDKPGVFVSQLSHNLLSDIEMRIGGWKTMAPAIETSLREKSSDPLWTVLKKWRAQARFTFSDEEILAELRRSPTAGWWRQLKGRPEAQPAAREIIREQYHTQVPPAVRINPDAKTLAMAAVAAGLPEALDCTLRQVGLKDGHEMDSNDDVQLSDLSLALGGGKLKWKDLPAFVRAVRTWNATDFTYDDESLTWKHRTQP